MLLLFKDIPFVLNLQAMRRSWDVNAAAGAEALPPQKIGNRSSVLSKRRPSTVANHIAREHHPLQAAYDHFV